MDATKFRDWVEWRLSAEPQPSGSDAQRRLGAVEIFFDMLLKVVNPVKVDMLATLVEQGSASGKPISMDHMWLMNAWGRYMQRRSMGLPATLGAIELPDRDADRVARSATGLLAMYASQADAGAYTTLREVVFRHLLGRWSIWRAEKMRGGRSDSDDPPRLHYQQFVQRGRRVGLDARPRHRHHCAADDGEAVRQVLDALGFVVGQP